MPAINVRTKGQEGEREVARDLNAIVDRVRTRFGIAVDPSKPTVQRNQNQTHVGGCDLVGTFGLAIEIKRQEQLSINTWWAQCTASAQTLGEIPVLLFRQNAKPGARTKWRCMLEIDLPLMVGVRAEIEYTDFLAWFEEWITPQIRKELPEAQQEDDVVRVESTRFPGLFDQQDAQLAQAA